LGIVVAAELDPEVRRFVREMEAGWARHPGFATAPPAEARRIAEVVRAPWARGGPAMAATVERMVPVAGADVRIRIHHPGPASAKPALVYLHGGGWTIFSLDTHDRLMREYAARAGVAVVGVDYALSPEAKFPVALRQISAVVRWLQAHAATIGVDPDRIALGGDSAGANLTTASCLALRDEGDGGLVRAMVLNYGVFDRHCSGEARRRFGGPGFMLGADEMDGFWRNYLRDEREADDPLASPINADLAGLAPAFLVIPECDLLTEQSLRMADRLRAAGVRTEANLYRGASHSFLEAVSIAAVAGRALDDTAAWLRREL
jgi:acetyl esterase